jgi:hypothetical protein
MRFLSCFDVDDRFCDRLLLMDMIVRVGKHVTTYEQVWILPGSVFGSDRWLEQLQQQHNTESANGTSCNSRFSMKDLMAVIEGNFFMRPYSHPVNITDGFFPSFQVKLVSIYDSYYRVPYLIEIKLQS